jgi:hypothetical protein
VEHGRYWMWGGGGDRHVDVRNGWRGEWGRGWWEVLLVILMICFMINSNKGLCTRISEKVSFICSLCLIRLYM